MVFESSSESRLLSLSGSSGPPSRPEPKPIRSTKFLQFAQASFLHKAFAKITGEKKRAVKACSRLFTTAAVGLLGVWLSLEKRPLLRRTSCLLQRHYSRAELRHWVVSSQQPKQSSLPGRMDQDTKPRLLWVLWGLKGLFSILPDETAGDGADQSTKEMGLKGCRDLSLKAFPSKDLLSILQYFYIRTPLQKHIQIQETTLHQN